MSNRVQTGGGQHGRAVAGALAGVALVVILAIVFFFVRATADKKDSPTAAGASAPAGAPSDPGAPPDTEPDVPVPPALQKAPEMTAGKGDIKALKVTPVIAGTGPKTAVGQQLTVNYVGATYKDGKVFESSWQSGKPVTFPIGTGQLIKGWDEGLVGIPVGSRVQLDIPADKAYGEKTSGGQPAGDLRFLIDILKAS